MHALSGHVKKLTEFFVDLYSWRIPDLNIVDGILAMEGEGPSFGKPRQVGRIIAGIDGIAVDAVCARMINFKNPRGIKLIDLAVKKGLTQSDLDHLQVEGPTEVIEDFVHPSTYTADTPGKKSSFSTDTEKFLQWWSELGTVRPLCNEALCNRCGDCLSACPSGAISIEPHPRIDPEKCLSCFCCVEVCPEKVFVLPVQELQEKRERMGM
jgi:ferredoxin